MNNNEKSFRIGRQMMMMILVVVLLLQNCQSQPTFSDNCQNFNVNTSVCQQCNDGFYLELFFCVPCSPNCVCSSKRDYCQNCLVLSSNGINFHQFLDDSKNQCILCNSSMPYCVQCKNQNFCTKCFNGQYLVQVQDMDGTVIQQYCSQNVCGSTCQICQDSQKCQVCQQSYFLYPNKTCSTQPCSSNCSICSSPTECQTCALGYYLNSSNQQKVCDECIANCSQCTTSQNCQNCAPSYNLANGSCSSNGLSNCVEYASDFTVCTACEPGFEVTAGACNQCTGCNLCNLQFICLSPCLPGFQPFNFACIPNQGVKTQVCLAFLIMFIFLTF